MSASPGGKGRSGSRTFQSKSWKVFRSVVTVVLALAFVPIVPASAFAEGGAGTGPLTVNGTDIYANSAPITITADATSGIDIAWEAGTYDGVAYEAGSYNYKDTDAFIYGGSYEKAQVSSSVTMNSGQVKGIYGGGVSFDDASSADVNTASVTIIGGTVTSVFGGGDGASVVDTATVFVSGGTVTRLFGGGSGGTWDDSAKASAKSYYEMLSAGGSDDPTMYCDTYVGTVNITVQGDAKIQNLYGGGLDANIVGGSWIIMPESNMATVNFLCASGEGGLTYQATDSFRGGNISGGTMPASGACAVYQGYAGTVGWAVDGTTFDAFYVGTCQTSDTTGEVFGDYVLLSPATAVLPETNTYITGRIDGSVVVTNPAVFTLRPTDGSTEFDITEGEAWLSDSATIAIPAGVSLVVDGTLDLPKVVNSGTLDIEGESATLDTLTNSGYVYLESDRTLDVDHINNTGVILKSDESTVTGDVAYHIVKVSSTSGGVANPEGNIVVVDGAYQDISYGPDEHSSFKQLTDNGVVVSNPANPYRAGADSADHTIVVSFLQQMAASIDTNYLDFDMASPGYEQPAAQTVTVTNDGTQNITLGNLEYGSDYKVVMGWTTPTLAPGESTTFTVQPVAGLDVGDHSDQIILSYKGTAGRETLSVEADFAVVEPVATIGTRGYPSLESAFAAAVSGDTITIQQDIVLDHTLTVAPGGTVTLTSAAKPDGTYFTISPSDEFDGLSLINVGPTSNPSTLSLMNIGIAGGTTNTRAFDVFEDGTLNVNLGTKISGFSIATTEAEDDVSGAAIHTQGKANVNMNGGEISGNTSGTYGGAISLGTAGTFTMRGGSITGNQGMVDAGAIWVGPDATMIWTGGNIKSNLLGIGGSNDVYVDAQSSGAGTLTLKTPVGGSVFITGATYQANRAHLSIQVRGRYGKITTGEYAWNPGIKSWIDAAAVARITTASGATATYHTLEDAMAVAGAGQTVTIVQDVTLYEPLQVLTNGAVNLTSDETISSLGTDTPAYYSIIASTSFDASTGHAMISTENTYATDLALSNINLVGNGSANIRAIRIFDGDTLLVTDGAMIRDFTMWGSTTEYSLDGAAVRADSGSTVNIYGGEISGNSTTATAGAVYVSSGAMLNMLHGTITGNKAGASAGGVFIESGGSMGFTGGTITGNTEGAAKADIFVAAGEKNAGMIALGNKIAVPATTIIEGVHADASYSGMMIQKGSSYGDISCPDDTGYFVWDSAQMCWTRAAALVLNSDDDTSMLYGTLLEAFNSAHGNAVIDILPLADTMITGNVKLDGTITVTADEPDVTVSFTNGAVLTIPEGSDVTLDQVVFDIVNGSLDNSGTVSTDEGGALYPTLATRTEVKNTAAKVGVEMTLTYEAVKTAGATTEPIRYQWYQCSNDHGDNPTPLLGASSSTFSATYANAKTPKYYYTCMATLEGVTVGSAIATVSVSSSTAWTRLYGAGRLDTMAAIVDTAINMDHACDNIIVTNGWGYADALSAAGLAGILDAPIITTDGTMLSPQAADEIERLAKTDASTTVYVLGGEESVSADVANSIAGIIGSNGGVIRLSGDNRISTGLAIYEKGKGSWSDTAIVTNGWAYADALSISSYAYASGSPIFLAANGTLTDETVAAIKAGGFKNVLLLGGTNAVSDDVMTQIGSNVTYYRLGGSNRLETSALICDWATGADTAAAFQPDVMLSYDGMAASNAWAFPDALASIVLLGQSRSVLLLVDGTDASKAIVDTNVKDAASTISQGYVLGSTDSVSDTTLGWLETDTE